MDMGVGQANCASRSDLDQDLKLDMYLDQDLDMHQDLNLDIGLETEPVSGYAPPHTH